MNSIPNTLPTTLTEEDVPSIFREGCTVPIDGSLRVVFVALGLFVFFLVGIWLKTFLLKKMELYGKTTRNVIIVILLVVLGKSVTTMWQVTGNLRFCRDYNEFIHHFNAMTNQGMRKEVAIQNASERVELQRQLRRAHQQNGLNRRNQLNRLNRF